MTMSPSCNSGYATVRATNRAIGKRFVTQEFGLPESIITSKWHFDHALPRSRNSYVDGVTVMHLIRQTVNTSWGGGYEKKSSTRALNIRGGLTLIALAKAMGVRGPAESRGGWEGVAEELHRLGVRSQMYARLKTPLTEVERLASELKLCANEPGASLVLSTPEPRPAPTFTADELSHLIQNLPSRINDWFDDDREGERRDAIRGHCETLAGYPHRVPADEVAQFIAREPGLFMLDAIVAKFPNVHSRMGAIGFTVEKSSPFGNLDRFTRLGISDFDM